MAQFQVYRLAGVGLVLDLQTELIETGSRVAAPLIPVSAGPMVIGRRAPVFEAQGEDHALHIAEMAALPSALLKRQPIADLSGSDHESRGALDMVVSGF